MSGVQKTGKNKSKGQTKIQKSRLYAKIQITFDRYKNMFLAVKVN